MCHKLARQVCSNHFHMELVKMEFRKANGLYCLFYPSIGTEIPLAGGHQYVPSGALHAEHDYSNCSGNSENTKEHLAEHFKVSASCHQDFIVLLSNVTFLRQAFLLFSLLHYFRFGLLQLVLSKVHSSPS